VAVPVVLVFIVVFSMFTSAVALVPAGALALPYHLNRSFLL